MASADDNWLFSFMTMAILALLKKTLAINYVFYWSWTSCCFRSWQDLAMVEVLIHHHWLWSWASIFNQMWQHAHNPHSLQRWSCYPNKIAPVLMDINTGFAKRPSPNASSLTGFWPLECLLMAWQKTWLASDSTTSSTYLDLLNSSKKKKMQAC